MQKAKAPLPPRHCGHNMHLSSNTYPCQASQHHLLGSCGAGATIVSPLVKHCFNVH